MLSPENLPARELPELGIAIRALIVSGYPK